MKRDVAVTFSIYGEFDPERLKLTILSLKRQNYSPLEIIVSEQNDFPKFDIEAKKFGVKYVFSPNPENQEIIYNPGKIRNNALNLVTADYIYTNDSDVIFISPSYIKDLVSLMEKDEKLVLQKPPMRRLLLESFDTFKEWVKDFGINQSINKLILPNHYVATTRNEKLTLVVKTNNDGRTYTIEYSNLKKYLENDDLKGFEPTIWFDIVHPGGIFAKSSHIKSVGGYCEEYKTWGQEDYDLQWKLSEIFKLQNIPDDNSYKVLHLDHIKGYFCKESHLRNQKIYSSRIKDGIEKVISFDKQHNSYKND